MSRCLAACVFTWLVAAQVSAETVYISDVLTVPLRSGPSNAHRILHQGLPSGTELEILSADEDSGFTQIRTRGGMEGWIRSQYLVTTPIARAQLRTANRRIEALEKQIADRTAVNTQLTSARNDAANLSKDLDAQVKRLTEELAEIKRISAGAIEEHATNQKLAQLNERLRAEVDALMQDSRDLQANQQQQWMLIGAGLVAMGLVAGVAIKSRPRRSGWS